MTRKIFVLDTNILLHDFQQVLSFQADEVVIPLSVIAELDRSKNDGG